MCHFQVHALKFCTAVESVVRHIFLQLTSIIPYITYQVVQKGCTKEMCIKYNPTQCDMSWKIIFFKLL
jgi:hypothetical protein